MRYLLPFPLLIILLAGACVASSTTPSPFQKSRLQTLARANTQDGGELLDMLYGIATGTAQAASTSQALRDAGTAQAIEVRAAQAEQELAQQESDWRQGNNMTAVSLDLTAVRGRADAESTVLAVEATRVAIQENQDAIDGGRTYTAIANGGMATLTFRAGENILVADARATEVARAQDKIDAAKKSDMVFFFSFWGAIVVLIILAWAGYNLIPTAANVLNARAAKMSKDGNLLYPNRAGAYQVLIGSGQSDSWDVVEFDDMPIAKQENPRAKLSDNARGVLQLLDLAMAKNGANSYIIPSANVLDMGHGTRHARISLIRDHIKTSQGRGGETIIDGRTIIELIRAIETGAVKVP